MILTLRAALAAVCSALLLTGCVTSATTAAPTSAAVRSAQAAPAVPAVLDKDSYRLNSGDKIRIEVFGEPDLTIDTLVEATGYVSYPLLGRLLVRGVTLKQLEQDIQRKLADGYLVKPSVRVAVTQFRPFYVTGQVNHVGAYVYVEGLTVEKAIAFAGGMTNIASPRKIYILRDGLSTNREHADLLAPVYPGDTIVVEEGLF